MPTSITLLGVPVHDVIYAETIALIGQFIAEGGPHQICTVNPEFVMTAQRDAEFMAILRDADLCVPDGVGLLWGARWNKTPLRERVAGSDLVPMLATEAAARQWRVFLLGAEEGVAALAAEKLMAQHPSLKVVGTWAGSPAQSDDEQAIAKIKAAAPQLLLVAYGAPAQDKWIARNRRRLAVPVMMGVGGALDFVAGTAVRAPQWMQRLGIEWLHRLIKQPWRWRRMLAIPQFVWAVLGSQK
jgi:N-acetylglucosaminyldiphosphoundecaprenol N-acetyl-beta-D-mannosaminyltransferase